MLYRINQHIVAFFLVLCIANVSMAFGQDKKVMRAMETYEAGHYYDATELLKDAYERASEDSVKNKIIFQIANCYREMNEPKKAELWFRKAIFRGYNEPLALLYYAQALQQNEKYEDAIEHYKKYKKLNPGDPRADNGITSCELIQTWLDNPTGYQVEEVKFINSRNDDYAPSYARDDFKALVFTSNREEAMGDVVHAATGKKFSDIFYSRQDVEGKWMAPTPLGESVNTEYAEGAPSVNHGFNTMYFTRCEKDDRKNKTCHIYASSKSGDTWGEASPLTIMEDTILAAHPAFTTDELTLYFVSNMPEGYGGTDIWMVQRESTGDEWEKPENLGDKINTKGNEVFPYVHPDGTLYFASNGHIGMGGLDIFKAENKGGDNWIVTNMRHPINSTTDDFGITFDHEYERGFFSSNRGIGGDDDIYSFVLPPLRFNMFGEVRNDKTNEPITQASVKIIGSDGTTMDSKVNDKGKFRFMLKPGIDYIFLASAENYLKDKIRITTKGLDKSKNFEDTIFLASIEEPIELPNIFYDYNKWSLRPESKTSLDKLVETLNDNPHITIELMAHTDSRGNATYNQELSQKRAQSVVDYLIKNGIDKERLVAKGYGESQPKKIDAQLAEQIPFFEEGTVLDDEYVNTLPSEDEKEIAWQINRRTEFKVLSTDYNK